mmetsp:Transcript_27837/g.96211  ORF Transcript_27837/g.96211 Transcript_27837/m.96211 type:complete len:330 (-) Transcript_27837:3-992(-)
MSLAVVQRAGALRGRQCAQRPRGRAGHHAAIHFGAVCQIPDGHRADAARLRRRLAALRHRPAADEAVRLEAAAQGGDALRSRARRPAEQARKRQITHLLGRVRRRLHPRLCDRARRQAAARRLGPRVAALARGGVRPTRRRRGDSGELPQVADARRSFVGLPAFELAGLRVAVAHRPRLRHAPPHERPHLLRRSLWHARRDARRRHQRHDGVLRGGRGPSALPTDAAALRRHGPFAGRLVRLPHALEATRRGLALAGAQKTVPWLPRHAPTRPPLPAARRRVRQARRALPRARREARAAVARRRSRLLTRQRARGRDRTFLEFYRTLAS